MHFPRSGVAGNHAQSLHYPCSVTALVTVLSYPRSLMLLLATKFNTCHSFRTKTTQDGLVTHERGGTHRDHDPGLVGRPALQAGLPGNRRQLHRLALLAAQVGLEDCCRIRVPHLGLTGTSACKARTNTGPDGRAVGNPPPHTHTVPPTFPGFAYCGSLHLGTDVLQEVAFRSQHHPLPTAVWWEAPETERC